MGSETKEYLEVADSFGGDEPLFGRGAHQQQTAIHKDAEVRYLVGCLTDEETQIRVGQLMTRSMHCQSLRKPGDVFVIKETGTFDKEGQYQIVIKYITIPETLRTNDK